MQDIMVSCKKCGNKAPASSMKLDLDEKLMICQDCVKSKVIHKEIKEEVSHKSEKQNFPGNTQKPKISGEKEEKSGRIGHKCTSCGYKFMINPETGKPKNCPYCNA